MKKLPENKKDGNTGIKLFTRSELIGGLIKNVYYRQNKCRKKILRETFPPEMEGYLPIYIRGEAVQS